MFHVFNYSGDIPFGTVASNLSFLLVLSINEKKVLKPSLVS